MVERMSKSRLIERIQRSWGELETLIKSLTPAELTGMPSPDGWTAKDHLAHLTAWEAGTVAMLQRSQRYEAMGLDELFVTHSTEEEVNDRIYHLNREITLDEVLAKFHETHHQMMLTLDKLSEDELYHTYSYFQPDDPGEDRGIPIIEWVKGNTYEHFDSHTDWIGKLVHKAIN